MRIDIVPVGDVAPRVKREASAALRSVYDGEVTVADPQPVPESAYDPDRDQYLAESFIDVAASSGGGEKTVAITPKDLYYRRRNYVFGLAYLDGRSSVVSTYRLQTSSDGGFSDRPSGEVFADRIRKEVVHEIGHTLGLEHCENNRCAMNFSPTVREVDRKEEHLCGTCQRAVF
ncbi:MAG: archaemetzincin family Zn-dependent metalloprotease [Halanaeroarchaeum sp.]